MREPDSGFIVMLLAFNEAAFFTNYLMSNSACSLKLPDLLANTVFWGHTESYEVKRYRAAFLLAQASRFWNLFLWAQIVLIHTSILVDIVERLRAPMSICKLSIKMKETMKAMLLLTVCTIVLMYFNHTQSYSIVMHFVLIYLILFYIAAIFTILFSYYMMSMLGLGKETKSKIFWREVSLIIAFTVCNIYPMAAIF